MLEIQSQQPELTITDQFDNLMQLFDFQIRNIMQERAQKPLNTIEVVMAQDNPQNEPLLQHILEAKAYLAKMLKLAEASIDFKECESMLLGISILQQTIIPMVKGVGDFPGYSNLSGEEMNRLFYHDNYLAIPYSDIESLIEKNRKRIELLNSKPVLIYCKQPTAVALFSTYKIHITEAGLKYEIANFGIGDGSSKRKQIRQNIEDGKYSGVVVIDLNSDTATTASSLMNILAHTLQGDERQEFERKFRDNEVVFPPVANTNKKIKEKQMSTAFTTMVQSYPINNLRDTILLMQLGEYNVPEQELLSVEQMLPNLIAKMKIPSSPKSILVVDDNPSYVENIIKILKAWPNIEVSFVNPKIDNTTISPELTEEINKHNIILLDEDLGVAGIKGSTVFNQFTENNPNSSETNFISITSGNSPVWTDNHFSRKTELTNLETARDFVNCINKSL